MRLSRTLYAQHAGFMFKKHWLVQGRRVPRDSGAKASLESRGLPVVDALEHVTKNQREPLEPFILDRAYLPKLDVFDNTHPLWNERKCYSFKDFNVLIEGIPQAQLLTKSIVIDGLPSNVERIIENLKISNRSDLFLQDSVRTSFLFDAYQEKLPKRKVPDRPAYNLPRDYGIPEIRRNRLLFSKILLECEKLAGRSVTSNRKLINDTLFVLPFEKDKDLLQIEVQAEVFLSSKKPIASIIAGSTTKESQLPDIFPLKYTVSMPQENIYKLRDVYPISGSSPYSHPHTVVLHFSTSDVKNLHGEPVTANQLKSRSMVKAFTVAASKARSLYGSDVKDLSEPIVVQSIQFDGQSIYFGIFQLNTLDLNGLDGTKNIWFNGPTLEMYSECIYKLGRPILSGYNPDVLRYFYGFYKNN